MEVNAHGVVIEKEGKVSAIEAEKILLSVGRKANLSRVGLDKLNIELHRNGVKVDEHLLTSHPRVYACGDITGYSLITILFRELFIPIPKWQEWERQKKN